uniref:Uncharacterized protein n=1 Tax=Peronospora matthiolae TaxID=2874970 RepID=A0AAV1TC82_9STRA
MRMRDATGALETSTTGARVFNLCVYVESEANAFDLTSGIVTV